MPDHSNDIFGKIFLAFAFIVMAFVAIKPGGFIKGITLGRSDSEDVSNAVLQLTRIISGIAAVSLVVSFLIAVIEKK